MWSPALALASLLCASAPADGAPRDVRWILGPASVELGGGRVSCVLPAGVALAHGDDARSILEVMAADRDGTELAVLSPAAPSRTWFAVVAWRGPGKAEVTPRAEGPVREGALVWLQRPRRDERTGRISWAYAGPAAGGPIVNEHLRIPASGGAVQVTLVAPVEELSEARAQLARIVDGLDAGGPPVAR